MAGSSVTASVSPVSRVSAPAASPCLECRMDLWLPSYEQNAAEVRRCHFLDLVTKRLLASVLLAFFCFLTHSKRSQLLCQELPCAQAHIARSWHLLATASAVRGLPTASREKQKQILCKPSMEKTANLARTLTGALQEILSRGSWLG